MFRVVFLEKVVNGIGACLQEELLIVDHVPTIIDLLHLVLLMACLKACCATAIIVLLGTKVIPVSTTWYMSVSHNVK